MAETRRVEPVVRICAVFSRYAEARDWGLERLRQRWGEIEIASGDYAFDPGGYYQPAMGPGLRKRLVGFRDLADPASLADWKHETNRLEAEYARQSAVAQSRPLNLDPGYVTQAKLVLATTKDRDHRVYLRDGIFAEVTLAYTGGRWIWHRWTYPDYRSEMVLAFVARCREKLRAHLRATNQFRR